MTLLYLVLAWLALSVPLSVVVGRAIDRGESLVRVRADRPVNRQSSRPGRHS